MGKKIPVLQCVAVCCSVLVLWGGRRSCVEVFGRVLQYVHCCSILQCVGGVSEKTFLCCSALRCVAVCVYCRSVALRSLLQYFAVCWLCVPVLHCVGGAGGAVQCGAVCCSVFQRVAVC